MGSMKEWKVWNIGEISRRDWCVQLKTGPSVYEKTLSDDDAPDWRQAASN